jgi:glycosyltransferase involved in cell wall biosynthesis
MSTDLTEDWVRFAGKNSMKIAWISFGFREYSINHAEALAVDHDLLLVLPASKDSGLNKIVDPRVSLYLFPEARLRQPIGQIRQCLAIVRKVREFGPDVVHVQQGHLWFNFALPALGKYALVLTIHDPQHHPGDSESRKTPQWVMDFGFRRADRVIVHGKNLVNVVRDEIGIPGNRIDVIPHIALGALEPGPARVEDDHNVLFFGRIWPYKGLEYLIMAEPLISKHIEDLRITIAGRGEDFSRYRQMMKNPARFEVHNSWISDDTRDELFQRAAVVVLPYVSATQSGVVPIAFSFGKPVVVTDVGALSETVDHGRTGLVVPPRDVQALAEAIITLLRNKESRRKMGANGRKKMQEEWVPDVVARRTVETYGSAIRHCESGKR